MKKRYESPTIQKMAFRYRDQVVAASGDGISEQSDDGTGTQTGYDWNMREFLGNLFDWIRDLIG